MTEQSEYDNFLEDLNTLIKEVDYEAHTAGYLDDLTEKALLATAVKHLKMAKTILEEAKKQ